MSSFKRVFQKMFAPKALPEDFVGYENLIAFMKERGLLKLEGDMVEIGAFMGGGTVKLARVAKKYGKKIYVIDIFEPDLDQTISKSGVSARDVYMAFLKGRSMFETYQEATRNFSNVVTIKEDSMKVKFPDEQKFIFGFVDGRHQRAYVENDFRIIWPRLVSGGAVGIHDYKYDDWPEVTVAVDGILDEYDDEIKEVCEIEGSYGISSIFLFKK